MRGLFGDDRDRLDGRRTGADNSDALSGEIHALMRPIAGVVGLALEAVQAREVRHPCGGQAAGRHHAVTARDDRSPRSVRTVQRCSVSSKRRSVTRVSNCDVAAQVEPVGDVVGIAQDFGLSGEQFAPLPVLLQLRRERIGILHALDVTACARVAVPVPGAADACSRLEHDRRHAEATHAMQHVHAGEAGPDDDHVNLVRRGHAVHSPCWYTNQ